MAEWILQTTSSIYHRGKDLSKLSSLQTTSGATVRDDGSRMRVCRDIGSEKCSVLWCGKKKSEQDLDNRFNVRWQTSWVVKNDFHIYFTYPAWQVESDVIYYKSEDQGRSRLGQKKSRIFSNLGRDVTIANVRGRRASLFSKSVEADP